MTLGSGLFSKQSPNSKHMIHPGGGLAGDIFDLRQDIAKVLGNLAGIAVEEYTNLPGTAAPGAAVLKAATATTVAVQTILPAALLAAGLAMLAVWPRPLSFTTAGTTPADAPANVVITGTDQNGVAQTETVTLAQTATIANGVKPFKTITSIVYAAGDGTGATISIGIGAAFVKAATATVASPVTVLGTALVQNDLANNPRQLVFTTAGTTPSDAPANVLITGKDINGNVQSETLVLAQTATTATSVKYYAHIDSLKYPAADGTGATIAVTFGVPVGLRRPIKTRAGLTTAIREISGAAFVTTGTFVAAATDLPNGSYSPASAPNDVNDYAIYYEYDGTQDTNA